MRTPSLVLQERERWGDGERDGRIELLRRGKGRNFSQPTELKKKNLREILRMGIGSISLTLRSNVTEKISNFHVTTKILESSCSQTFLDRPNSIPGLWTKNKKNTKGYVCDKWGSRSLIPRAYATGSDQCQVRQVKLRGSLRHTSFTSTVPRFGNRHWTAEGQWQLAL